ncbi:hypothetical protein [Cupriavidus necator]|uniref:hypothetical protein n=1 Tax=Cupriavidus necator TaxID=106590 RepID=UPI0027858319|nr:hypothetical protein [Cupriavidus necator]MDQ0140968.1 hypothetical protein [Cupriavidus necator]
MTKDDLETGQLSLDFTSGEHATAEVTNTAHEAVRPALAVVVSNKHVASPKRALRPALVAVEVRDIYSPEVTFALHKYADALGW